MGTGYFSGATGVNVFMICLALILIPSSAKPDDDNSHTNPESFSHHQLNLKAGVDLGTHITGIGGSGSAAFRTNPMRASSLAVIPGISADAALSHYERNLGIKGRSQTMRICLTPTLSFGKSKNLVSGSSFFRNPLGHILGFKYIGYLSTDGTSQPSGMLLYQWRLRRNLLLLSYENDWYSFLFTDQYRTAAADITFIRKIKKTSWGLGTGFKLWTGETRRLPTHTHKQFPMAGQHGSAYSHGIFYVAGIWNYLKLSVGYDSESIRDGIQNTQHDMIEKGRILPLDRDDRFYLQLTLNDSGTLY